MISEIAEFETMRLGFLHMIKETILSVYDNLTNPNMTEPTNLPQQIKPLLDTKPALTWIQYELPTLSYKEVLKDFRRFIRHHSSVVESAALKK